MASNLDYYEVLGVDKNADAKTIKRAFLKKAQKLHPDVNDAPDAEERFKEINEAYSVLSDEQKRANYDRYGDPNGPGGMPGYPMDDFFDLGSIFSSFFRGGAGGASPQTEGEDKRIDLVISLEEAASGCTKTIEYPRLSLCDDCGGTGLGEGGSLNTCATCHGSGAIFTEQASPFGRMRVQTVCPDCRGEGHTIEHPCETCGGQGRTPDREKLEVKIPAGIRSGQSIRFAEKGDMGLRGERAGDLYVRVAVKDSDRFERDGNDLYCIQKISALEAICGCSFDIDGILEDEKVRIDIPAGTQHATRLTFEGSGMPIMNKGVRGNLVVVVDVEIPTDLSASELKSLRKIAKAHKARVDGATSK